MDEESIRKVRKSIRDRFGELPLPKRSYLVLMSPRSGSTLLCTHLEKIGYGRPTEGFHFSKRALQQRFGSGVDFSDPYQHMRKVLEYGTVGDVFGLKFSWVEFEIFLQKARRLIGPDEADFNDAEVVRIFFPDPAYIHLKRRGKVKQAVSYARAMQDGIWHVEADQDDAYKDYILPAVYDREHIEALLDTLLAYDLSWDQYLHRYGIPVLEIWYEDLARDYVNVMQQVYDFLGIKGEEVIAPPLKKQADSKSRDWVERFEAETPWLRDEEMASALEQGEFQAAYLKRTMMLVRQKERARWNEMPASRFRKIRRLLLRIRRKIGL